MTTATRSVVVGAFESRNEAEGAIQALRSAGFDDEQLGFAMRGGDTPEGITATDAEERAGGAAEGAATGLLAGGIVGGVGAALVSLLIPGVGPIIGGGILATVLGGAAVGAAAGGLLGALTGMGVPEQEAQYFHGEFESGRPIVTVKAGDRYDEALAIIRENGGYDMERSRGGSGMLVRETTTTTTTTETPYTPGTTSAPGVALGSAVPGETEDLTTDARMAAVDAPLASGGRIDDVVPDSEGDALASLGVRPRTMEDAIPPTGSAGSVNPPIGGSLPEMGRERIAGEIRDENEGSRAGRARLADELVPGDATPGSERVTRDTGAGD